MTRFAVLVAVVLPAAAQKQHDLCAACHKETVADFRAHPHFRKAAMECAACHGESTAHRTSQGHTEPDRVAKPHEIPELCGACHAGQGATPIAELYSRSLHGKLVLGQSKVRAAHCGTCHGVHRLRQGRSTEAQCRRCHSALPAACSAKPHRPAAAACAGCHDPHTLRTLR